MEYSYKIAVEQKCAEWRKWRDNVSDWRDNESITDKNDYKDNKAKIFDDERENRWVAYLEHQI